MSEQTTNSEDRTDGLERLLEVEERIDERLAASRAEAGEMVRAVQAELAARAEQLEGEIQAERQARLDARSAELRQAVQEERDGAARQARRLRAIPVERVEALARDVIERLLADRSEPAR